MTTHSVTCPNCRRQYRVKYDENDGVGQPEYCPMCGDHVVADEEINKPPEMYRRLGGE